jgi:hypothetical protein
LVGVCGYKFNQIGLFEGLDLIPGADVLAYFVEVIHFEISFIFFLHNEPKQLVLRVIQTHQKPELHKLQGHLSAFVNDQTSALNRVVDNNKVVLNIEANPSSCVQDLKAMTLRTEGAVFSLPTVGLEEVFLLRRLRFAILYEFKPAKN